MMSSNLILCIYHTCISMYKINKSTSNCVYHFENIFNKLNCQFCLEPLEFISNLSKHVLVIIIKVSKGAKIRNRYNQVPHLTQDTNGKVTYSQLDTTNDSQEASPFPAGDHKAHINRRAQRHSKHETEKTQKMYRLGTVSKIFHRRA